MPVQSRFVRLLAISLVGWSLSPLGAQSDADRAAMRKRFLDLDAQAKEAIGGDPRTCGTGNHPVERDLIVLETSKLLESSPEIIAAWFELALRFDARVRGDPARRWAQFCYGQALTRFLEAEGPDEIALTVFRSQQPLLAKLLREAAALGNGAWSSVEFYFPMRAMESLGNFDSIAALMEVPEEARTRRLEDWLFVVESLTGRAPTDAKDGTLLSPPERLASFRTWWNAMRSQSPAASFLRAAKERELSRNRLAAWSVAQHFADPAQEIHLKTEDLKGLLESRWPAETIDNNDQHPREPMVARPFSFVRDAAFLLLFRRDPTSAMRSLGKGLELSPNVFGQGIDPAHSGAFGHKASLFAPHLSPDLDSALTTEIKNPKNAPFRRFQWFVIRDQFFPPPKGEWLHLGIKELVEYARPKPTLRYEIRRIRLGIPMTLSPDLLPADAPTLLTTLHSRGF